MRSKPWTITVCVAVLGLFAACAEEIDGPTPAPASVTNEDGTNVICTCDSLAGCIKDQNDVLTVAGAGFAPLPVELLGDEPRLELPTLTLTHSGGKSFVIDGAEPAQNPAGVRIDFVDASTLTLTLTPDFVKDFPEGMYALTVDNPNGNRAELADALEVVAGPVLETVVPDVVCDQLDTPIKLTGKNFRQGAQVLVGETALATVNVVSETSIEATVPKGFELGKYDVSVVNPEGCASTLTDALEVVPPPTLTSVSPDVTCSGGAVVLNGTGFRAGATVLVGQTALSGDAVTVDSETQITVNVGTLTPGGPYDVSVQNVDGCSSSALTAALTVTPGPIVVAVDPNVVYSKVAFPVTLFGDRFESGIKVTLATSPATELTLQNVAPTRIDAVVPAGLANGTYDLIVTDTKGCSFTFKGAITVTDQLTVAVCGIDPTFGYSQAETAVTITSGSGAGCSQGNKTFVSTPRAWLNVGGNLKALKAVAFVTATSLTGTVPSGLAKGGPYDLVLQNPDGSIGLLEQAFTVVDKPVPLITAINPGDTDTQYVGKLTLTGQNFRSPATIELLSAAGATIALANPTVASATQATADLDAGSLGLAAGAYVVRLTNTDQKTYSDFSALAITNPAGNLGSWKPSSTYQAYAGAGGPACGTGTECETGDTCGDAGTGECYRVSEMTSARRRHALVAGRVSAAQRFLYAIGGDGGGATPQALQSVELVPLDKFGNTGSWVEQRYSLNTARTGVRAFAKGRYIYVVGGDDGSGVLSSVERAMILDPAQAPEVDTFSLVYVAPNDPNQSTLAEGSWYYRVSATMPQNDADNPGGETLPSDPVVLHSPVKGLKVTLSWKAVQGAVSYNVYRSAQADAAFGEEQLLADGITGTSYEDLGGAIKDATQTPLPIGATGVWVTSGQQLGTARSDAALTVATKSGKSYVYVAGGRFATGTAGVLTSVERAEISADGATVSAFQAAGQDLPKASEGGMLVVGENETSPLVPAGTVYLYAAGGYDGSAVVKDGGVFTVGNNGNLGPVAAVAAFKNVTHAAVGYMVNDTFYYFGGTANGQNAVQTAASCELTTAPAFKNCNSLAAGALPAARMHAAIALESAFFYIAGGGATANAATKTVIKTVY